MAQLPTDHAKFIEDHFAVQQIKNKFSFMVETWMSFYAQKMQEGQILYPIKAMAQSARAVEYTDCISAEE